MEFRIQKKDNENIHKYPTEDLRTAQKFAQELKNELGEFLMSVIVFGSSARKKDQTEKIKTGYTDTHRQKKSGNQTRQPLNRRF